MKHKSRVFFIASILVISCTMVCAQSFNRNPRKVILDNRATIGSSWGLKEGDELVIRGKIDLNGKTVILPADVLISFQTGAALVNGTLKGNGTHINARLKDFLGVKLDGTWCVNEISDEFFSQDYLTDNEIINNLNVIQSDTVFNEMTISRDHMVTIPKTGGSGLLLSSNSKLLLNATLTVSPNNYKSYNIIDIKRKENVRIRGGKVVGDVGSHSYIEGTTSEWGMGLNIDESKDIVVEDTYISRCTGDGIYISGGYEPSIGIYDHASKSVHIKGVICDSNRRQGMSIIHVDGLFVSDCSFVNTGQIEDTAPAAGIDIEPNVSNNRNMSVRNVEIDNCVILNNKGSAVSTNCTYEDNGRVNYQNILFSNCHTDGLLKAQSTDMTFRNCFFKEIRFASVYSPTHITLEACIVSGGYGIKFYAPSSKGVESRDRLLAIDFRDCSISLAKDNTESSALFNCYKSYVPNLEYISIENCRLFIPKEMDGKCSITDYSFMNKMRIRSSTIEMPGREFDAVGLLLENNKIRCARAVKMPVRTSNLVIVDEEE